VHETYLTAGNPPNAVKLLNITPSHKNLEASATAADPSSFNVIRRLVGNGQVTPV